MRTRPLLAATASVAALGLCVASSSASAAATTASPAKGTATSDLSLLQVSAAGHTFRLGDLSLLSDTLTGKALSSISLTPLTTDGTAVGKQTVTPANSPISTPVASSPGPLSGIVSLTAPVFHAAATDDPAAGAGADSLGSLKLLGLDIPLDGTLDLGSEVSSTAGATAAKALEIDNLALPSIADLLAALGLDLTKLPVTTLNTLVDSLDLVTTAVTTARTAAAAALASVGTATTTLNTAIASLATANTGLTAATDALQAALDQIPGSALVGALAGGGTVAGFLALTPLQQGTLEALVPTLAGALTAYDAAQTLVDTATAAVAAAQSTLDTLVASLQGTLAPLVTALTGALDATPLLSIDELALTSTAVASSNKAGGQRAEVLGGTLTGLHVLGTDVLDDVLGTSSVDLVDLVGSTVTDLTSTIGDLTDTLSTVLSTIPSLPALKIPAPQISLLTKSASTSISDGFGRASTSVSGLRIALPAVSIPAALTVPNAGSLPGLSLVNGLLSSTPVSLSMATLSDQAAFAPAVVAVVPPTTTPPGTTPPSSGPVLASTGLPAGLAVVALLSIGGALVLRRRISA